MELVEPTTLVPSMYLAHQANPATYGKRARSGESWNANADPRDPGIRPDEFLRTVTSFTVLFSLRAMEPRLPSETHDLIIDHLHDDVPTLRQCSLVCKAWLPAARLHIFSIVDISLYSIDAMLQTIFYPGAPFPSYIRELHIIDGQERTFDPKWVPRKVHLVPFDAMTQLSRLALEQIAFEELPGAAMDALRGAVSRVKHLDLAHVSFSDLSAYTGFLGGAPSLRSLITCNTTLLHVQLDAPAPRDPATSTPLLPHLREVNVDLGDRQLLDLICSPENGPPPIGALSVTLRTNDYMGNAVLARVLKSLGGSLTHLFLESFGDDPPPVEQVNLSSNAKLHTIVFGNTAIAWMAPLLNTCTASPSLKRVYSHRVPPPHDFPVLKELCLGPLSGCEIVFMQEQGNLRVPEWLEGRVRFSGPSGVEMPDLRAEYS
ncbi:APH domain-containing protein [Mycena chlorophos]|uniref:APH domain-containing protein n=1 Tax=Mycena chlorophos TaxID=658473 RepID=A0A8H6SV14_MYCCL|nr:APH domain-containing protein [Mycena chlorophos]